MQCLKSLEDAYSNPELFNWRKSRLQESRGKYGNSSVKGTFDRLKLVVRGVEKRTPIKDRWVQTRRMEP